MRKHTNGGVWECMWYVFHKITANHTKALSRVANVKLLGVKVSLCVANIPDSQPSIYRSLLENKLKNSAKKCAQEKVIQDIKKLQDTCNKVLSAEKSKHSSSRSSPPFPLQQLCSLFQTLFAKKNQILAISP